MIERLLLVATGLVAGCIFGFWLADVPAPTPATPAPEVRQSDGSVLPERVPEPEPPALPHMLPPGAKPLRLIEVRVQPEQPGCEPLDLTVTLAETADGVRPIVQAPHGEIVSARDRVFAPDVAKGKRLWAAMARVDVLEQRYGALVTRDVGRLRAGVEVFESERGGLGVAALIGFTF